MESSNPKFCHKSFKRNRNDATNKAVCSKSTLVKIYNAIVLSHFDYCSLVWDNCCDYLKNRLQKLQNRAARIITGKTYEDSSEDV